MAKPSQHPVVDLAAFRQMAKQLNHHGCKEPTDQRRPSGALGEGFLERQRRHGAMASN